MRLPRGSLNPDPGIKEAQGDPRRRAETGHFRASRGLAMEGVFFSYGVCPSDSEGVLR